MAVKAVIIKGNKILFMKRSQKEMERSYMNRHEIWDFPGGSVRFFETAEKGLRREIKEETGLDVMIIQPFHVYDAIREQVHLTICTYFCEYSKGEVRLSGEHAAYLWLDIKELDLYDIPKWMKKIARKGFGQYQAWKKRRNG